MALPFTILAAGSFDRESVTVEYDASPRPTTPALDARIADLWAERQVVAKASGQHLFNGELLRYVAHDVQAGRFRLTVGPTCYRDFVGTNLFNREALADVGWSSFANPVGTTATLRTADGIIVYGRRSHRVAFHAEHVHTFGGALEIQDRRADGTICVFDAVLRELQEELGLATHNVHALRCVGLIRDCEIVQPELLFEARLTLTLADVYGRFRGASGRDEHVGLCAVIDEPALIVPFMREWSPIAPVAVGALFLHGKAAWGEEWARWAEQEFATSAAAVQSRSV